ncbi:Like-Sm ribonucleoprotein, eukaryotic and archaea-type, core, partial [mine drainage metagenome]
TRFEGERLKPRARVRDAMTQTPSGLLTRAIDQEVELFLKDHRSLRGQLRGFDDHMNMVLSEADESDGQRNRHLGLVVVRGSNVISLNAPHGAISKAP